METSPRSCNSRDILANPRLSLILFWLPAIVIVAAGNFHISDGWRTAIWTAALATMGTACSVNAARCGRVHCYLTGPFFLAMALLTLLYGLGEVPLGRNGWSLIGLIILAGAILLCCLPEWLFGKYRNRVESSNRG